MKKKYYLICLTALLGCLLAMPGRVMADPTGKALVLLDQFLYFVYDETDYTTYDDTDPDHSSYTKTYLGRNITAVTTGIENLAFDADNLSQWGCASSNISYVSFESSFSSCRPKKLQYWFHGFTNLSSSSFIFSYLNVSETESLHGTFQGCNKSTFTSLDLRGWTVSNVKDLNSTFLDCTYLSTLYTDNWDVSNVTDMSSTFMNCNSLTTLYVGSWDTGSVTSMNSTFSGCQNLTSLPVSNWDVSNVTDLKATFANCQRLATLDVHSWDVSKVTTLESTFQYLGKLNSSNFTLDVSSWGAKVGNVTTMKNTFYGCQKIESLGSTALRDWNVSKVTDMYYTFADCTQLTALNVGSWNVGSVTTMERTFSQCRMIEELNVTDWTVGNVETLNATFYGCSKLALLPVGSWSVGKVTNMNATFYGCSSMQGTLPVNYWNVSNVTTLEQTFQGCGGLTSLPVDNWNVSKVTTLNGTFSDCSHITALNVDGWKDKLSNVTIMSYTFSGCSSLASLSVENWNVSNVRNMLATFQGCSSLTSLDLSTWNTGNVYNMNSTFQGCSGLTSLDVSTWNTGNVETMNTTFNSCSSLKKLNVHGWDMKKVTSCYSMFYNCSSLTSLSFGENYSRGALSYATADGSMFGNCPKLRYIDFYDSDATNTITAVDRVYYSQFQGVPLTTVIYLPAGSMDVTDVVNVVYTDTGDENKLKCPNYYSEDKVDIEFPRNFLTKKAEYYRAMSTTYGSVILPYDFTTDSYVQAYTLDEEHIPTMYFKDTQTVLAHTPFAYKKLTTATFTENNTSKSGAQFINEDTNGNFSITVNATHTTSAEEGGEPYTRSTILPGWKTKGYYINETVVCDGNDYSGVFYISGDKFYEADGPLTLYPHRVTFHGIWEKPIPGSSNYGTTGTRTFEITTVSDSQIADAIDAAEVRMTEREANDIYDVQGRRHNAMQRGINIVRMKDGSVRKTMVK